MSMTMKAPNLMFLIRVERSV